MPGPRPRDAAGGSRNDGGEAPAASRSPNHYRNGRAFEWRIRSALQEDGYLVLRTAGSKSKVDLLAIKPGQVLIIQCKRNGTLPTAEWNAVVDIARMMQDATMIPVLAKGGRGPKLWQLLTRKTKRGHHPMAPFATDLTDIIEGD